MSRLILTQVTNVIDMMLLKMQLFFKSISENSLGLLARSLPDLHNTALGPKNSQFATLAQQFCPETHKVCS